MEEKYINAIGIQCPGPLVELFKVAKKLQPGDLIVIDTDAHYKKDIDAWIKKTKNELLEIVEKDDVITARIRKV